MSHPPNPESLHDERTTAEIESRLRADGHSQTEIDATLALVVSIREALAHLGWDDEERKTVEPGAAAMTDELKGIPMNCPLCGAPPDYLRTHGDTHFFRCPRHGVLVLSPDGRVRQIPQ
jgi:hypothetical protein